MRRAIRDTNVILNLVINRDIILIPCKLIILEKPIPSYNNILSQPTENMTFGLNVKANNTGVKRDDLKKVHQTDTRTTHLDSLDDKPGAHLDSLVNKPIASLGSLGHKQETDKPVKDTQDNHTTELATLLVVSSVGTFLVTKYML